MVFAARSKFSSTQSYTPEQLEKWKAEDMTAKYMNELDVKALKELEGGIEFGIDPSRGDNDDSNESCRRHIGQNWD